MEQKQFDELVAQVGEQAAKQIDKAMSEAKKGLLTPEQLEEKLNNLSFDAKSVMIGEKSLEEVMRIQGEALAAIQAAQKQATPGKTKSVFDLVEEKMDDINRIYKSKQGNITISLKAAVEMDTENTIDNTAIAGSDGVDITDNFRIDSFVPKRYDLQYIFDIADRTVSASIPETIMWEEEGDRDGAFANVEEGAVKPLMSFDLVKNISEYKKSAGKIVVTEELMKFKQRRYQRIKSLFNDHLLRDHADNLTTSLVAQAASYVGTTLDGTIPLPTRYDAIGAVCAQLEALNWKPDILIINPQDKWAMALEKDADGRYFLNIPVVGANGQINFLMLPTISTNKIDAGEFIVGESKLWKIEEEAVQLRIGYGITVTKNESNVVTDVKHDLDTNKMRMIAETFYHEYIASNHEGSFVKGEYASIQAALLAEEI